MQVFENAAATRRPGDQATFLGTVTIQRLAESRDGVPAVVYRVEFQPGARTNWHAHTGAQWLLVTAGRIRVQVWGQPAREVVAGDAVVIAPGEKHWHGATPTAAGSHLAINLDASTEWMEPVTDDQYAVG